jgi:hypothetical protein
LSRRRRDAPSRAAAAARESFVVALAALAYAAARAITERDKREAAANGLRILHLERALHIDWERGLQAQALAHGPLTTLANWTYIWGFWPSLAAAAVFLYARRRDEYRLLRNAIFLSGLIGFLVFALLPVAPPRLVDPRLVDTIRDSAGWYRTMQPPSLTDQFAAMPSLHVGWSLLVGLTVARALGGRAAYVLGALLPAAMAFAVVVTANHYVADVLVGSAVALAALVLAARLPTIAVRVGSVSRPVTGRHAAPAAQERAR